MAMLDKAFEVMVVFSAVDRLTAPMERMGTQMGLLDKRSQDLQKRLNEFKNMAFVGAGITMAGTMMLNVIEKGVDEASEFITKMTIIRDTTGATADQMERIQKIIRESSGQTIFGVQETASFGKLLATSGMSGDQIEKLLPVFTQYAEVQKLGKGSSPEEAIKQAIGAAHMTGNYDPDQLAAFLDKYNKATFMTPGASTEFADTFKYLSSRTQGIGMSTDDQLMMAALSNRVGLAGSIGGTEGADLILRSIPGLMGGRGKKPSKQTAALDELGLSNTIFDANGNFKGLSNFIQQLQKSSQGRSPEQLTKLYHDAFGQQGMGLANILSSSRGQEQLTALVKQMGTMKSIGEMQEDTNKTPEGQMLQLKTNIDNLKLGVFLKLAEYLNPVFFWLNMIIGKLQGFADAHPMLNRFIADFMILFTAMALVVGPLMTIVGALGYLKAAGMLATGVKLLGASFTTLLGPVRALIIFLQANPIILILTIIIGTMYLLYTAWTENWGGIQEKAHSAIDYIENRFNDLIGWLTNLPGRMYDFGANFIQGFINGLESKWESLKNTIADGMQKYAIDPTTMTLGINSPSKVMHELGQYTTQGFALGMLSHMPMVSRAAGMISGEANGINSDFSSVGTRNGGGDSITIAEGAIVINPAPGQSADEIANAVMQKLSRKIRNQSYGRPDTILSVW